MSRRNRNNRQSVTANTSTPVSQNVSLAVNHYLAANNAYGGSLRQQMALASVDTKHPQCWDDYGYPKAPCFLDFYTVYKRSGLGKAGVELLVDKCWQSFPWVRNVEDRKGKETEWEKRFSRLANRIDLFPNMKILDNRQRTGRYGAFLMIVGDDKDWSQPITGNLSEAAVKTPVPLYESQIRVLSSYQDEKKENYGLPEFYEYNESAIGDQNPDAVRKVKVHESRVIPWAEGASGNSIYGIPALEAGLNNLLNIDKIDGAGAEGFYKNVRSPSNLEMDKEADVHTLAQMYNCKPEELSDEIAKRLKSMARGFDNALMLKGIKVNSMAVSLPNPKEFVESNKKSFAASVKTPLTLLEGNQSGNQASQENGSTFDEQAESRRANEIDRFIKKFIRWLEKYGVLAKNEQYWIYWDSLLEPSLGEKLDNAKKMADIVQTLIGTGVATFTGDNILEAAGYEPLKPSESIRQEDKEVLPEE